MTGKPPLRSLACETHTPADLNVRSIVKMNLTNKNYIQANEARQIKKRLQTTSTLRENATDMTAFTAV